MYTAELTWHWQRVAREQRPPARAPEREMRGCAAYARTAKRRENTNIHLNYRMRL